MMHEADRFVTALLSARVLPADDTFNTRTEIVFTDGSSLWLWNDGTATAFPPLEMLPVA